MKTISLKTIAGCILLSAASLQAAAQTQAQAPMTPIEQGGKKPIQKLTKGEVPKAVLDTFVYEYPAVVYYDWYGYPVLVEEADWYVIDPETYTNDSPEYYVTEFVANGTPQKVMYNKNGKKIATHRKMKEQCPKAVTDAFDKSAYKNWKLLNEKEEISQGKNQAKVYKFTVENGKEKHALYYGPQGTLLKDKKLKM